jgi:PAS domain S-box-containing protein
VKGWLTRIQTLFDNLSLRKAVALALLIGLTISVGLASWGYLTEQRTALLQRLNSDHARIVEVLALGMQTPLWELRPEAGRNLLDAVMLDERVTAILVSSPLVPQFLETAQPERRQGEPLQRMRPVMFAGERIGEVLVEMDAGHLAVLLTEQWGQMLITGLLQLVTGTLIIFVLLRFKVMTPLRRLVRQSEDLAAGVLNRPREWQRNDELGVLGRSFEKMRCSLRDLVADLERRNQLLREREAALVNQTSILQAILDNMTDGVNLVDENLRLVAWNHRFLDIMELPTDLVQSGCSVDELIEFNLQRGVFNATDPERLRSTILDSFREVDTQPIRFTLAGGRRVDVRRREVPGGGVVSTFTDVTEELEARRRVDETRNMLETIVDAVPAMLNVKDRQLRYQLVNHQFLNLAQLERGAVLGRTNDEICGRQISPYPDERDQQVITTGKPLPFYEVVYDADTANPITVWTTKVPLCDADGRVTHIITVGLDISERKKAEAELARHREALHQSEKLSALGSLLSGVAHELNNPLSVVVGRSFLLEEQLQGSAFASSIAKVRATAERCARIVKTFLTVARQQETTRQPIHISDVLTHSLDMVGHRLYESGIVADLDIAPALPTLMADPDQLSQVFMHLLVNAQQALDSIPEPRRLRVSANFDAVNDEICVQISDNGPGIPRNMLHRIFEPFFTTRGVGEGSGVGLSVSHGIIHAHGGTITVDVPACGGTLFEIRLPRESAEGSVVQHPVIHVKPDGRHILIIDDVVDIGQMLGEILTEAGYQIDVAEDGQAALKKLDERCFDLIVSDLSMPQLDGPGLYKALQERNPRLLERLIFVTGDTLSDSIRDFLAQVNRPVIEKPFVPEEIRRVIELTLAQANGESSTTDSLFSFPHR